MRCEDEKMFYRPPLLEEPCAQTLSGIKTCKLFALFWLEENIWTMPFVIEKAWEIHEIP